MLKLFRFLREDRKECILAPLFKLFEAALDLLVPLVVAWMIDRGVDGGDRGLVLWLGALLVGLGLAGLAGSITAQYFAAKAAVGFSSRLRHGLFAHIQRLSYPALDTIGGDTLITRMSSDVNQIQTGINLALRLLLRSPFIVFGALVMAFVVDAESAGIFAAAIGALCVVVFGLMLWGIPRYKTVQQKLDQVTGSVRENLSGVRVLRAFNRQGAEVERFDGRNGALTRFSLFVGRVSALMNPLTLAIVNLALAALLQTGAVRISVGALTQGQVTALVEYLSQILVELVKLANLTLTITKAWACGNRVQALLETPPEESGTAAQGDPEAPAIAFEGVGLAYPGAGEEAVSGLTFTVPRGSVFGIIGGTGSGKSTVANLIPGFYKPTSGRVRIDGVPTAEWDAAALRQKVGVVAQRAMLFRGTIRENLLWGDENASEAALRAALERSQSAEFVDKLELGLDAPVEQGGRNLSGGQRQRLTIARALARNPEILILDDSASALDFATDAKLRRALRELEDTTVIVISQRTSSIQFAAQILVLDDGEAVGLGTHDELLKTCPVYREIYESQYKKEGCA